MKKWDNPYKPLFALGVISGILGVILWPLFSHHWLDFYPRQSHVQIMFFAFFWSFVAGFLFTAIPRMTGASMASTMDLSVAMVLILLQNAVNYTSHFNLSVYFFTIQTIYLLYFIIPRFLEKRKIPFDGFLFFPSAFLMSLSGIALYFLYGDMRFLISLSGEAFLTNLILGLGSRLVPALSRLPNAFMHPGMSLPLQWKTVFIKVSILNLSFVTELLGYREASYAMRLAVVGYMAVDSFGLFKKSRVFSTLACGLKISVLFMLVSYTAKIWWLSHSSAAHSHLLYIGGFSLLTILVATRVTLAHSQSSLDYELKSIRIFLIAALLTASAISRWIANSDFSGYAATVSILFFVAAVFIWLLKHLSLIKSVFIQKD